jgi:MFS family permease
MAEQQEQADDALPLRRNREFQLFWVGSAISVLGSVVSGIAYPLLVLSLRGSAFEAGLVSFASSLPSLLVQLPAGALVDRWDRKRVMIVCDLGRALLVGTIPVALFFGTPALPHLMVVAFLERSFSIFYGLCEPGAVRNLVPPKRLGTALSQMQGRGQGASLVGQPLGGFLFAIGRAVPFVVDALSYLVSLITLLLIRKDFQKQRAPAPADARPGLISEIKAGLVWLWHQPFLRAAALLISSSNLLFQIIFLMLIVIAKKEGASSTEIGFMLTGVGIGGLLGSFAAPWCDRRLPRTVVVIGVNWLWALLMPLMLVVSNVYLLGAVFGMMAFLGPIWNVSLMVYQLSVIPEELLGRVQSALGVMASGTIPLGALLGGYMLDSYGTQVTALAVTGTMLLIAIASTLSPALRSSGRDQTDRVGAEPGVIAGG